MKVKGHAKDLKLDGINASNLAMETLLSLTSKRAGEWFKSELRELGGVDHLLRTIEASLSSFSQATGWSTQIDRLSKVNRCLKVIENVTVHNDDNQVISIRM